MEYVADMILELRDIAETAGAGSLARILALAHAEARAQQQLYLSASERG